jgi:hypothetical protein
VSVIANRLRTVGRILWHFVAARKWFMIPLLLVILLAGMLLLATGGLSYVAPFLYTIF